jgi:hypothetical protein
MITIPAGLKSTMEDPCVEHKSSRVFARCSTALPVHAANLLEDSATSFFRKKTGIIVKLGFAFLSERVFQCVVFWS